MLLLYNSLKAYTYLITWYMRDFSKLKDDIQVTKGRKKKNVSEANAAEINEIVSS